MIKLKCEGCGEVIEVFEGTEAFCRHCGMKMDEIKRRKKYDNN